MNETTDRNMTGKDHSRPSDYVHDDVYSLVYSMKQLKKFLTRRENHWRHRVAHVLDSLSLIDLTGNKVLDLGTSIGTFAIELYRKGYDVTGLDIDPKALDVARMLARHYSLDIDFREADASVPATFEPDSFDAIIAEDIFEHLHDDTLRAVIENCLNWLKPGGYMIFHTYPSKYDYIFHDSMLWLPLIPFASMRDKHFRRVVEFYHYRVLNTLRKIFSGKTYEEKICYDAHCNLLTKEGLVARFERAGFWVIKSESSDIYRKRRKPVRDLLYGKKSDYGRNITGICWKPFEEISGGGKG